MGLGDDLMATGHIRGLQARDPRKVRIEYGKPLWSEVFDNNPRIARPGEVGDFQVYRPRGRNGLRPYISAKSVQRWTWQDYEPPVGELYFTERELDFARKVGPLGIVLEPLLKPKASPNKNWGEARWLELVRLLREARIEPAQLLPNSVMALPRVRAVVTPTFRLAAAVLANARAAVLHEGGMHHAAAVVGTPAVVIYGGYISPRQTGYNLHTNLFTGGEPCGRRFPCGHCARAMAEITPKQVFEEAMRLWASTTART